MNVYAKIGTGPQTPIRIKWIRKCPIKGQRIEFKFVPLQSKWGQGIGDEVKNMNGYLLYFVSRT